LPQIAHGKTSPWLRMTSQPENLSRILSKWISMTR
jgi:hypothetical protein